jgi:hypothetical protein
MQFDFVGELYKYGIYAAMIIGALILAYLARNRFARGQFQEMEDSDKLEAPTYEHMDSGVTISDPDDEEDDP